MKKKILISLFVILLSLTVIMTAVACKDNAAVTGVKLDKETLSLEVGGTGTLVATVNPAGAKDKSVKWSSANTAVATVDANGKVTAVAEGETKVTVTTVSGGKTASATITVTPAAGKKIQIGTFLNDLVTGIDNVANDLKATTDKNYVDATIFFKFNEAEGEVRIAGTFDEKILANNTALLSVKLNGRDYVQLYTEGGVVYLGQTIIYGAESDIAWVKLSQAEGGNIIEENFAKIPAMIKDTVGGMFVKKEEGKPDVVLEKDLVRDAVGEYLDVANMFGNFIGVTTEDLDYDLSKQKGGVLTADLKLDKLGGLLTSLGQFGLDINALLEDPAIEEYGSIIDTVVGVIFNGTLDQLIKGQIANYPEIKMVAGLSDSGRLNGLKLSYKNEYFGDNDETVEVAFGIKNLVVSKDTTVNLAPAGAKDAGEAVAKLTVGIDVPGKDIKGYIEGFIFPEAKLSIEDGELAIDLSNVGGYATAYLIDANGNPVQQALTVDFNTRPYNTNVVRINLKDLYSIVGLTAPDLGEDEDGHKYGHGYTYAFNLDEVFNNWFAPEATGGPVNAEGQASTNPIDLLVAIISGEDFDPISFVTGNLDNVTAIIDALSESFDAAVNEAGRFVILDLIEAIVGNEVFAGSDEIAEYLEYVMDRDAIIASIEDLMDIEEIMAYVKEYTGFDGDEDDLLALEIDVFGVQSEDTGIGFGVGVYSGDTLVAEVVFAFDLVTGVNKDPQWLGSFNSAPNGNLATEAGQDAILDSLKAILEGYKVK